MRATQPRDGWWMNCFSSLKAMEKMGMLLVSQAILPKESKTNSLTQTGNQAKLSTKAEDMLQVGTKTDSTPSHRTFFCSQQAGSWQASGSNNQNLLGTKGNTFIVQKDREPKLSNKTRILETQETHFQESRSSSRECASRRHQHTTSYSLKWQSFDE